MPKYNQKGFQFAWSGRDSDILRAAVDLVLSASPKKMSHDKFEKSLRRKFRKRTKNAGSWAISLEHNRLCRLLEIECRPGAGAGEIVSQIPIIKAHIAWRFPGLKIKIRRTMKKKPKKKKGKKRRS